MKNPPATQYLKLADGTIAYDDTEGKGQPIICPSLMGDTRAMYRPTREFLVNAGYRVITMDLRGLGESSPFWPDYTIPSMGADLLALIEHLKLKDVILVGESISAGIGVWATAEKPEVFSALIATGPFIRNIPTNIIIRAATKIVQQSPVFWMMFYKSLYRTHKPSAGYLHALQKNLQEPGRYAATCAMMTASHDETKARYDKVMCPVLVVMGAKDPDFKDPEAEASLVAHALRASKVIVPNAGHIVPAEFPEQFAHLVTEFMQLQTK